MDSSQITLVNAEYNYGDKPHPSHIGTLIISIIVLIIGIIVIAITIYNNTRPVGYFGKFSMTTLIVFYICGALIIVAAILLMVGYFFGYKKGNGISGIERHSLYYLIMAGVVLLFIIALVMLIYTIVSHASNAIEKFQMWVYITMYIVSGVLLLLSILLIFTFIFGVRGKPYENKSPLSDNAPFIERERTYEPFSNPCDELISY